MTRVGHLNIPQYINRDMDTVRSPIHEEGEVEIDVGCRVEVMVEGKLLLRLSMHFRRWRVEQTSSLCILVNWRNTGKEMTCLVTVGLQVNCILLYPRCCLNKLKLSEKVCRCKNLAEFKTVGLY